MIAALAAVIAALATAYLFTMLIFWERADSACPTSGVAYKSASWQLLHPTVYATCIAGGTVTVRSIQSDLSREPKP